MLSEGEEMVHNDTPPARSPLTSVTETPAPLVREHVAPGAVPYPGAPASARIPSWRMSVALSK